MGKIAHPVYPKRERIGEDIWRNTQRWNLIGSKIFLNIIGQISITVVSDSLPQQLITSHHSQQLLNLKNTHIQRKKIKNEKRG